MFRTAKRGLSYAYERIFNVYDGTKRNVLRRWRSRKRKETKISMSFLKGEYDVYFFNSIEVIKCCFLTDKSKRCEDLERLLQMNAAEFEYRLQNDGVLIKGGSNAEIDYLETKVKGMKADIPTVVSSINDALETWQEYHFKSHDDCSKQKDALRSVINFHFIDKRFDVNDVLTKFIDMYNKIDAYVNNYYPFVQLRGQEPAAIMAEFQNLMKNRVDVRHIYDGHQGTFSEETSETATAGGARKQKRTRRTNVLRMNNRYII